MDFKELIESANTWVEPMTEATGIKPGKKNYVPGVDYTDPKVALVDEYNDVFDQGWQQKFGLDKPLPRFKNVAKYFDGKTSTALDDYSLDGSAFPMVKSFDITIDMYIDDYTTWNNFNKEHAKGIKAANDLIKEFKKIASSEKIKPKKIVVTLIDKKQDSAIQKERKSTQAAQLYKLDSDRPREEELGASISVEW